MTVSTGLFWDHAQSGCPKRSGYLKWRSVHTNTLPKTPYLGQHDLERSCYTNMLSMTILARVGTLNDCRDVAAPDKVIDSTQTYLSDWWTGRVMRVCIP